MNIDLTELRRRIEAGLILTDKHPELDLTIYNYTTRTQYKWVWDEYTTICRGLILDPDGSIISRPFPKFFNLNETPETLAKNLPNEIPSITEKLDGVLGVSFPENHNIAIATRGRFKSPYAIWATDWLRKQGYVYEDFKEDYTYCFEIIYPGSKIVVDYGNHTDLVLLAVINTSNAKELNLKKEAEELGLSHAPEYRFKDLDEAEEWLSGFKGTEKEGLVLHYKNGLRIKIKSEDYKRIHKILTGLSAKDIWATLKAGASLDPILHLAPDELYQWIKDTERELIKEKDEIFNSARRVLREVSKFPTRKEQATQIIKHHASMKGIVFSLLDGKEKEAEQATWDMVEPSGEVLKKKGEKGMNTDLWHFWNYNFLSRQYPARPTKKHKKRPNIVNIPYKCNRCKETFRGRRYKTGKADSGSIYTCPKCHDIRTEQASEEARTDEARKSIEKAKVFEELLADCSTKGTCDILAAHHEAFKDDPDRLRTDFLVSLICGTEKAQKYKKTTFTQGEQT